MTPAESAAGSKEENNKRADTSKAATEEKHVEVIEGTKHGGTPDGWEAVQAESEPRKVKSEEIENKAQEVDESGLNTTAGMAEAEKSLDEKAKVAPLAAQSSEKDLNSSVPPTRSKKTTSPFPKIAYFRVDSSDENAQGGIKKPIRPNNIRTGRDVVIQALNYLEWDSKNKRGPNTGLLHHHWISKTKFEKVMNGYYETTKSPGEDFFPPSSAIKEFTDLYRASRHMLNESRQAKGGPLNRGDVRALSWSIMRDLAKFDEPRIDALDIHQRLRLKFVLQRTFRAHATLDSGLASDDDDKVPFNLMNIFTEGLERVIASIPEALPDLTKIPRLLLLPTVLALAILLYAIIWRFSNTLTWDSAAVSRVFNNSKLIGYLSPTNSSSTFLSLHQQLEVYKLDVNSTVEVYEECDLKITQAVDLVLRRNEKLATDLKMIQLTIKFSKNLFFKPFFRLFRISSEEILRAQAIALHETYLADLEDERYDADLNNKNLKRNLENLETGLWQMEQTSQGKVPFDLNRFINKIVERPTASFSGKRRRAVIHPDVLDQFRLYNSQVKAFSENYVYMLLDELKNLREVVRAQHSGNKSLQGQIDDIVRANVKLRKIKKSALVFKSRLESNGTISAAGAAILEVPV